MEPKSSAAPCLARAKPIISRPMQRATYHRVECAQDTTDLTTSKPTLAGIDQTGGVVELDFDKSISDGVNIYSLRGDEADFVFLPAVPVYQLSTLNSQLFRNCVNTKPSMSKATPRLTCSAMKSW